MVAIPEQYLDILQSNALAYVATTGPKDSPQVSPIWFVWESGKILFSTTKARQKFKNILRQPDVSVAITDPQNPFRSLEIRGTAHGEDDHGYRVAHLVTRKYLGHDATPEMLPAHEERVAITITPEQLLVFAP
jgi:PPOX class probable F420-dependent enzyme